jgi:mRNA interferase RelE/StbE
VTLRPVWDSEARRDFRKLPRQIQERTLKVLNRYAETGAGDVVRLRGIEPPEWRLRVGDYRIRFRVRGGVLEVLRVAHRRDVYR